MSDTSADEPLSARQRARIEITRDIAEIAKRQLADVGAAALSLRAVARELGMASSAVYRYVESRDDLLTRLIVDTYNGLGDAAEQSAADSAGRPARRRWLAVATAIRNWAVDRPHEWALLYGSPVPGYAAPEDTVLPGTRVSRCLAGIAHAAVAAGELRLPPPHVDDQPATYLAEALGIDLEPEVQVRLVAAWTQLFGLISFEVFGQTKGLVDDDEAMFTAAVASMATWLGLSA